MDGKTPLIKFADRPPLTVDEIKTIWKKYPLANIALRTDKFFVVDIDRHQGGEDGFKSIARISDLLPETLAQATAGGGKQLLYLKRSKDEVRQNIGFLPGVDIKAHVNNYVVVAPSTRDGKSYQWINKLPMVPAPKKLIKKINTKKNNAFDFSGTNLQGVKNKTTKLFEILANGLGNQGGRNDTLTSFVGGLFIRGVEPEDVYKLVMIANENTNDPLPEHEINKTFKSVQYSELRRRKGANR